MEEQLHNNNVLMYSNIMIASNCWYVYKIIKNKMKASVISLIWINW